MVKDIMGKSYHIRKTRVSADDPDIENLSLSPSQRLALMWQLTVDSWTFQEDFDGESRLPRHIVSVRKLGS